MVIAILLLMVGVMFIVVGGQWTGLLIITTSMLTLATGVVQFLVLYVTIGMVFAVIRFTRTDNLEQSVPLLVTWMPAIIQQIALNVRNN